MNLLMANVALPAFFPHAFATLAGIFVIAGIEGFFLMRLLRLSFSEAYMGSLSANWRSTVVGIPLAWLLWVVGLIPLSLGISWLGVEMHPMVASTLTQSALSGGTVPTEWEGVGSAAAWLVMLVPFWLGSVWIESKTIARRFPEKDASLISKSVIQGNLASYVIFLILGIISLWMAMVDLPNQKARYEEIRERQEQNRVNHLHSGAHAPH